MLRSLLVLSLSFLFANSGLAQPTPPRTPAVSFAGDWDTDFGRMTLTQSADKIQGHYQFAGRRSQISGTLEKSRFTFTYQEPTAKGEGWFELARDGRSFQGRWREAGQTEWGEWSGRLAETPNSFTGVWSTSFGRMRLTQDGDRVSGVYSFAGGSTLSGTIADGQLNFRYEEPTARGEGTFRLAADGRGFQGTWKQTGKELSGDWSAERVVAKPNLTWLVVLESRWEGGLSDHEYTFGDMLRAFFSRTPQVQVRHRFFTDNASFRRWCGDLTYLAEPVVLVVAAHGSPEGVQADGHTVSSTAIGDSLRLARNVKLLHFSACDLLRERAGETILSRVDKSARFPISGYKKSVDWAGSAIIEFAYLELILSRGLTPKAAAVQLRKLLPFSGDDAVPDSAFGNAGFRLIGADGD